MANGKLTIIGRYENSEEAAEAYNIKARELFGRFAYQNVIKKGGKKCPQKKEKTT